MNAQDALVTLRRHESALRARGIHHAAVFGSTARGENRPDSDLDIVIDLDPEMRMIVFDYVGLKEYIAGLFEGSVDVVSREGLKAYVRSAVAADAVYAF
jgi:predicted nucleotidyltransferase